MVWLNRRAAKGNSRLRRRDHSPKLENRSPPLAAPSTANQQTNSVSPLQGDNRQPSDPPR
jgi:hypothetical protein